MRVKQSQDANSFNNKSLKLVIVILYLRHYMQGINSISLWYAAFIITFTYFSLQCCLIVQMMTCWPSIVTMYVGYHTDHTVKPNILILLCIIHRFVKPKTRCLKWLNANPNVLILVTNVTQCLIFSSLLTID